MKRTLLSAILLLVCGQVAHASLDAGYQVSSGDLNNDGLTDLYVSRSPDLVILHGDVIVPIVVSPALNLVLLQNADRTFSVRDTFSSAELGILRAWSGSTVQLSFKDLNVDGQLDMVATGFAADSSFPADSNDQIVFGYDSSGVSVQAVDSGLAQFMSEIYGWMRDKDYFEREAIRNGWYSYAGNLATGWFNIGYINIYYSYDNGKRYLDENDNPYDPANVPAYCEDYPLACQFRPLDGVWAVWGEYLENIVVIFDYSNYTEDALAFAAASGDAFHEVAAERVTDAAAAKQILEGRLGAVIGETVAAVLAYPIPWPEFAPETAPLPQPRRLPRPLPDAANDPEFGKKWQWRIVFRVGALVCGIFCPEDTGDPAENEAWEWYNIGLEWALQDLLENELDPDIEQVEVVIGEGEGLGRAYARIPAAAATYGALYFNLGVDEQGNDVEFTSENWSESTASSLWRMNSGWIRSMMLIQSQFYDIGLYGGRSTRGKFYVCEREELGEYPYREERSFRGTSGFATAPCELW